MQFLLWAPLDENSRNNCKYSSDVQTSCLHWNGCIIYFASACYMQLFTKKHNCTWKSKIQDKNVCALLLTTNSKSVNLYLPRFIIMSFLVSLSCLGMHPRSALLFHLVRTSCILEAPLWRGLVVLMVDTIFHLQILILLQLPLNRVLHFVYVF